MHACGMGEMNSYQPPETLEECQDHLREIAEAVRRTFAFWSKRWPPSTHLPGAVKILGHQVAGAEHRCRRAKAARKDAKRYKRAIDFRMFQQEQRLIEFCRKHGITRHHGDRYIGGCRFECTKEAKP